MYTLHRLIAITLVLVSPARMIAALPVLLTATPAAQAATHTAPNNLTFDTTSLKVVDAKISPVPNFDTEVLAPLKASQEAAAKAAKAKTRAKRVAAQPATKAAPATATGDLLAQLRYCEAGGDYTRNSGNGYFGAYQYNIGTWSNYGGYARPDLAPASVQDAKALETIAARGWSPWPTCARRIGAM